MAEIKKEICEPANLFYGDKKNKKKLLIYKKTDKDYTRTCMYHETWRHFINGTFSMPTRSLNSFLKYSNSGAEIFS